ncbi:MAG: site-specific integrase [Rhodospirillaceae bacterium]|jgi:integrase|nr:site-specific integrase [Rhodospirillaceae bacterium]MBT6537553.1 site-specific integrase [Rhodospirillaceae bacterium]
MTRRFLKLTRNAMRALNPGESINEQGINFRREPTRDGVFTVNIMVDRLRVHRVIGRESEGTTRQQAEDFIARARTDARRERLDLPEGRKTALGFREAAGRYIERLKEEDGKIIATKDRQLRQHLTPFFRDRPLSQVSGFEIERYKKVRCNAGAAVSTVNRELATLSHLFNKSLEWGWIKALPARIRRFQEDNARIVYLSKKQCHALEAAAAQDQNENVHAFVMVGLRTGMRHSEILAISRNDLDLDKRVIWIPKAKAGAREQPITGDLAIYLEERLKMLPTGCPWLFPSPGSKTGHVHTIRKAFRRSVIRAGLDPEQVTPHTLRHTAITHLVQAGVDLPTVKRISGHKTMIMVERYAHQSGAHIAEALDKLEDRYSASQTSKSAPKYGL